uniref:SMC hinge domain-containing protein n=1 Tax=Hucho hucho TaxID=62062 RepID=A0A4W5KP63_9TELE
ISLCLFLPHSDPERGWDRSRVKGLLANLITVSDVSYSTGLEVVAGGKLYNVVVDTEVTGKKLLEKGELKRRYTIIPLNKISARTLNDSVVNTAKSLVRYNTRSTNRHTYTHTPTTHTPYALPPSHTPY